MSSTFSLIHVPDCACVTRRGIIDRRCVPEPRDDDAFGPLDFVANILYQHEGGEVRWGNLRDDLREKYRAMAVQTVSSWAVEEIAATKLLRLVQK